MIARWMIVGFVLWIIVALAFRFVGGQVFLPGPDGVTWMFMILPVSMLVITYLLLIVLKVEPTDRAEAASIMAVPGLLIGIYQINSFSVVFPDINPSLSASFASLMYACYAAVIIAGIVASRLVRTS
ncbi:MAG: DUF5367 domain-containing protein [Hyphomonadaceae bacterium]|nr:DUF5367 domain-containing protein [Hyphomonadaceae bacterium]